MKFITYFDYLGFGDFIRNNDLAYQKRVMGNIFRDIESALAKGKSVFLLVFTASEKHKNKGKTSFVSLRPCF